MGWWWYLGFVRFVRFVELVDRGDSFLRMPLVRTFSGSSSREHEEQWDEGRDDECSEIPPLMRKLRNGVSSEGVPGTVYIEGE